MPNRDIRSGSTGYRRTVLCAFLLLRAHWPRRNLTRNRNLIGSSPGCTRNPVKQPMDAAHAGRGVEQHDADVQARRCG